MKFHKKNEQKQIISENRKAYHNYDIIYHIESGLVLKGTEVKSLRNNRANISESYVKIEQENFCLINSYIPEYSNGNRLNHDPRRIRLLLLNYKEIHRLFIDITKDGMTIVPTKMYFNKKGIIKLEIGLAKGKKKHEKREIQKKRDWNRKKEKILKTDNFSMRKKLI